MTLGYPKICIAVHALSDARQPALPPLQIHTSRTMMRRQEFSAHLLFLIRQNERENGIYCRRARSSSLTHQRMKETLIDHICQMFLFSHAVPEDTQLCLGTKLLILSLSLSLWNGRSHARTRARSLGGREDVKSFHAQRISPLEHRTETHSPKDVDLPTKKDVPPSNINNSRALGALLRSNRC